MSLYQWLLMFVNIKQTRMLENITKINHKYILIVIRY